MSHGDVRARFKLDSNRRVQTRGAAGHLDYIRIG